MKKQFLMVGAATASFVILSGVVAGIAVKPQHADAQRVAATCNNTASDAATINTAISGSSAGDEIVISGPCLINAQIKLLGDRAYRGDSRGTVLKQASGANISGMLVSDSVIDNSPTTGNPVSVKNITLDGNKSANATGTDGMIIRSWQTTIADLQVRDFSGNGIKVTNKSANGTALTNTQVNGRIANVFVTDSGKNGIYIEDSGNSVTDWNMVDNWVASSGIDGIRMDNAAGWVVERNHVYGVPQNAINANRLFGTSISDNYIEDFGRSATKSTYYGIVATVQGDTASNISGNKVFNLNGEITGSTYRYIGIAQVNYGTGQAVVSDNNVRGAGKAGSVGLYYSKGNATALVLTSTGNNVTGVATQRSVGSGVTAGGGV